MDAHGNVVALTQSIENVTHPYYLRPNAVPWASVAPTIVFRSSEPWLAIGSPDSERIPPTILQVLLRLRNSSPMAAVDAPRIHCSLQGEVSVEASRIATDVLVAVVKTHTCWKVPVYRRPLSESEVERLLGAYHSPYHDQLSELGRSGRWPLGVDCHTMAASGPPVGPDHGKERPWICLSNGDGTCPRTWIEGMRACFAELVDGPVNVNDPFRGGYITRSLGEQGDAPGWILAGYI
ncbi:N-formylglutamate amidohydrolase [Candidatus Poriferisodalis sp.]|uniref:N-formylglutamate amidohydrolase n=1 Tax=Candidatus Poriferisodalis sp. TaxID=3101277 RepID=UPI003AF52A9C